MVTVYDVEAEKLIKKAAAELKKIKEVESPTWAVFVKTGASKERPPMDPDWWYIRAAAVLRKLYLRSPVGVIGLKKMYGGKKNRGHKPERVYSGSGKIIRVVLQQLEKAGLVKSVEKDVRKGRTITPKGKSFLDQIAKNAK